MKIQTVGEEGKKIKWIILAHGINFVVYSDIIITTKLFWGGKGLNERGLSKKHIMEGIPSKRNLHIISLY